MKKCMLFVLASLASIAHINAASTPDDICLFDDVSSTTQTIVPQDNNTPQPTFETEPTPPKEDVQPNDVTSAHDSKKSGCCEIL